MASIVVDDPSIGEALGVLAKGLGVATDPKRKAEAFYLQQRINKAQQEAQDAAALTAARDSLASEFERVQQYQRSQIRPEISPEPGAGQMGPLMPVANPRLAEFDANAGFARSALRAGMLNATNANDLISGAYLGRGQGQLATTGLPQGEQANRVLSTQLTGKLPDASVAFTDDRRRMMAEEANDLEIRKSLAGGVKIGQNETFIPSPQQRWTYGFNEGPMQGQVSVGGKETIVRPDGTVLRGGELPQPGAAGTLDYAGNAMGGQALNKLRRYALKVQQGGSLTPEEYLDYIGARGEAFPTRIEYRQVGDQSVPVKIETPVPPEFNIPAPGGNAVGGPPAAGEPLAGAPVAPSPGSAAGALPSPSGVGIVLQSFLTAPPSGVPAPAPAAPAPSSAAPAAAAPAPAATGAGGLPILSPSKTNYTEAQGKDVGYATRMMQGADELEKIETTGTMPGVGGTIGAEIAGTVLGGLTPTGAELAQEMLAPGYGKYASSSIRFLTGILRKDTGAAVGAGEYPQYYAMFIPRPSDSAERRQEKALARKIAVQTMQQIGVGFKPEQIYAATEAAMSESARQRIAQETILATAEAAKAKPAGAPATKVRRMRVDPGTGEIIEVP